MICCHVEVDSEEYTECPRCGRVVRRIENPPPKGYDLGYDYGERMRKPIVLTEKDEEIVGDMLRKTKKRKKGKA